MSDDKRNPRVLERATVLAAVAKLKAALRLLDTEAEGLRDDALADAGVLCKNAGVLLETVYDSRLQRRGEGAK